LTEKRPLISVVVPFHNNEPDLAACLDSIATQSYDRLEVVMVDDTRLGVTMTEIVKGDRAPS